MSEYTQERDRKCPRCGKPLPLEISVRAWHLEECGNYSTRKDKLARIDETARAVFAQRASEFDWPLSPEFQDKLVRAAWDAAIALERARDEAVKELP